MPWFKVDDRFWAHRKVMRIPGPVRLLAAGAWVLAGSWCAQQASDGEVSREDLCAIYPGVPRKLIGAAASALVLQGLWEQTDAGWRFHDWAEMQPTRASQAEKRAWERERKARQRRGADGRYLAPVQELHDNSSA